MAANRPANQNRSAHGRQLFSAGSPAERAGVTGNGFLISVDGTNVVSLSITQSMNIVRGPVGTFVKLGIADSKMSHTNEFTVKRSKMAFSQHTIEFLDQ